MNYMKDIAKVLGVEFDKEFEVKDSDYNPYKIPDEGLVDCDGEVREWLLMKIITGKFEIIKKLWKPQKESKHSDTKCRFHAEGLSQILESETHQNGIDGKISNLHRNACCIKHNGTYTCNSTSGYLIGQ